MRRVNCWDLARTRDPERAKRREMQLRELSHSLLKLQDQERGRLGRELHDSVGQYLVAIKGALEGLLGEEDFDEGHRCVNNWASASRW